MELIPGLPDDIARECLIRVRYEDFPIFFNTCRRWKVEITSKLFHQQRKAIGLSRPLIILTQADPDCSFATDKHPFTPAYHLSLHDPETGSWSRLPPIPGYPDGIPLFCQCVGVGPFVFVIGGWNPTTWNASNTVYTFDFVSATWKRGADMPGPPRSFFGCASDFIGTVFVAGGHDEEKNALRSALAYNVIKDEWVRLPDMAKQRDECKGIFHAGKFKMIGGYCTDTQGKFLKDVEVFHVDTWRWCQMDDDLLQTEMCPRNFVVDDKGNLFRCHDGNAVVLDGSTWREVAEVPTEVHVGSFMMMWQGKMLVIGSDHASGGIHSVYVLRGLTREKSYKWTKVETPRGFSGNVQAGCILEI